MSRVVGVINEYKILQINKRKINKDNIILILIKG